MENIGINKNKHIYLWQDYSMPIHANKHYDSQKKKEKKISCSFSQAYLTMEI